jgi:NTE family protein
MSEPRLLKLSAFLSPKRVAGQWQFDRYRSVLRDCDKRAMAQLKLARHQFLKPLLYAVTGATAIGRSLGLLLVSLPFLASLIVIFAAIDWGVKKYLKYDIWRIITDPEYFRVFLSDAAPGIYVVIVAFVLSTLAEKMIRGSGRWAGLIQQVLKGPMSLITGLVLRVVLPAVFAIPVILYVHTIDRYFVKVMGKLE